MASAGSEYFVQRKPHTSNANERDERHTGSEANSSARNRF